MNHEENNRKQAGALAWLMKEQLRQELEFEIEAAMNRLEVFTLPDLLWRSGRVAREDRLAVEWLIFSVQEETL